MTRYHNRKKHIQEDADTINKDKKGQGLIMSKATTKQGKSTLNKIYDYIVEYITTNGYAPSVKDIANGVGLSSTSSVHYNLTMLKDLKMIEMKENTPRAIKVVGFHFEKDKK